MRVKMTSAQIGNIHRYAYRIEGVEFDYGCTWIEASVETLEKIAEELEFALGDDHETEIAGGAQRDLSDVQLAFGVQQRIRSIGAASRAILEAIIFRLEAKKPKGSVPAADTLG